MKKFLLVLLVVLGAIGILAACAPATANVEEYVGILPGWAIIVGAVVLFLIGIGIIWKLIPGFIKVLAILALAVILAGTAYGIFESPWAEKMNKGAEELRDSLLQERGEDANQDQDADQDNGQDAQDTEPDIEPDID